MRNLIRQFTVKDPFWKRYEDLLADVVIPYQEAALRDQIPDAEKSHSIENFEMAADVMLETTGMQLENEPQERFERSREYWVGWAVCYYQWLSGRSYSDIFKVLSFEDLQHMYHTLHEADISKFADIADERIRAYFNETNLKRIRTLYGCTQAELSRRSGVSLRSIQMYEQRKKDINKASAETLYRISKVLACSMEDLIEK